MPILTPPDVAIAKVSWKSTPRNQKFESELNGDQQVIALPGDRWSAVLTVVDLRGSEALSWIAFLISLGGMRGRFWLSPPGQRTPAGTAQGAGIVSGANQVGSSLTTGGWDPDQAELLLPGDYFQVGQELKMVTAPVGSNASGVAVIPFAPVLRKSPLNGASIITTNPACVMMMADDNQTGWDIQGARIYAMTHACVEALDI